MLKLRKFLKPFKWGILLALIFLLLQALSDLYLPNYMSKIVNVGIQQNGIEQSSPKALSQYSYKLLQGYMTEEEKKTIEEYYSLTTDTQPVYILKDHVPQEILTKLNNTFNTLAWLLSQEKDKPLSSEALETLRKQAETMDKVQLHQQGIYKAGEFFKELGGDLEKIQRAYIIKIGLIMLGITLLGGIATILVSFFAARTAAGVGRDIRKAIFAKVSTFSHKEFDEFSTASLITRSTNDVSQIQMLVGMGLRMLLFAPIMAIGGIIMALNKSVSMGWVIALGVLVIVGLIISVLALTMPRFKAMQKYIDKLNLVARETLNGLMVIRAFGTENFEKKRFSTANTTLAKNNLFVGRAMMSLMTSMTLVMNCITVLIVWVGAHYVAESRMQVGDMMAFMQYALQILMSFLMISMMFLFIPRAAVSAQRIAELLDTEPAIQEPIEIMPIKPEKKGFVEFCNVSFKYNKAEEEALKGISFVAKPGETTAFIGATGSGKSTLVNLIPRFYDVTEGEVLVNGVNVKNTSLKTLRAHIGYVPQKSVLMSGTIGKNIAYGVENLSEEEMKKAAEIAQALTFIEEKPETFESEISQGGSNVSGGQKQRLSIARALAIKPDIYIFDDSFSALDYKTDSTLRLALKKYTGESTVIVVAQRISTILNANRIYVIDKGSIVGEGTHQELLKNCPEYYEIVSSQLTEEEF